MQVAGDLGADDPRGFVHDPDADVARVEGDPVARGEDLDEKEEEDDEEQPPRAQEDGELLVKDGEEGTHASLFFSSSAPVVKSSEA